MPLKLISSDVPIGDHSFPPRSISFISTKYCPVKVSPPFTCRLNSARSWGECICHGFLSLPSPPENSSETDIPSQVLAANVVTLNAYNNKNVKVNNFFMIVGFSNLTNVCLYFVLANVFGRCKYSGEMVFELGDIFVQKAN